MKVKTYFKNGVLSIMDYVDSVFIDSNDNVYRMNNYAEIPLHLLDRVIVDNEVVYESEWY